MGAGWSGQRQQGRPLQVVTIREAGLDGFWIHRLLEANGVESHVVEPESIAVARRHRRAKADATDGETLLRRLMAYNRGERRVERPRGPAPRPLAPMRPRNAVTSQLRA